MVEFLEVIDAAEAHHRFREAVRPAPLGEEPVPLAQALAHVVAADVVSSTDVPGFDRSNVDGYAVRAEDTFGADERTPRPLADAPRIVTGGILPRGADAVVMIEHTYADKAGVWVTRALTPGANVGFAGSDIARGQTVHGARRCLVVYNQRESSTATEAVLQ